MRVLCIAGGSVAGRDSPVPAVPLVPAVNELAAGFFLLGGVLGRDVCWLLGFLGLLLILIFRFCAFARRAGN
jgi:hypothetical protein